ncbi:MAG: VCBS repeat-containing protein [Yoonia sp.]|uniref:FG-GAP repeat domain-containing protein n=1 Tax=Yoonia sp. TaxID=2212373 RepID=UPI0032647460
MLGRLTTAACLAVLAGAANADVTAARYAEPTTRYAHGILGDAIEFGALVMTVDGAEVTLRLPETHVFEDVAPRLIDIDLDGTHEVMVVETKMTEGARISIYNGAGELVAATPHIGRSNRWYSPVGAADLDGDGLVEVAFIDRPHLAKTLRVWQFDDGDFTEVAAAADMTNHRIGEADIAGGIRDCGDGPEMIVATGNWTRLLAVRFDGELTSTDIGPHAGRDSFAAAIGC